MSARAGFAPWQARACDRIVSALDAGRLGHGLLFCGPGLLGKHAVAEYLARRLLCTGRDEGGEPCGECRGCLLMAAGSHPDYRSISFIPNRDGTRLRTEIVIEQIRELSAQLALTPQYGGAQVAIIDPADAINTAAGNALLKTLEEPVPGRYLWLVTAFPARLPATIRSRCQRVEFRLPPYDEALAWLQSRGHGDEDARDALEAARGHPGLANQWLEGNGLDLRREVAEDLQRLERGLASPLETAQRWTGDEDAELRLRHAADLAVFEASRLTDPARTRSLATWFDKANRTRDLLRTTVRADLAVVELLLAWRAGLRADRAADVGRRG
ncbi:DNA polymerase III subunit delta' [Marilutibacter chinensis]|uniref:DNA-directed DNA polymerase n=1 Tax=Marilutibacter chinensis TaxID=2912247 RepID=A0ABS9HZC1_9GAMM|nr:DNA polymerase III subunit delta' [Lysobacter chinensis]MCF7223489.1 DNA polymerase III subunit delta' [Lysobacter chinensis]